MKKFCKYCGSPIDSDSLFCSNCGKPLNINTAANPAEYVPETVVENAQTVQRAYKPISDNTQPDQQISNQVYDTIPFEQTAINTAPPKKPKRKKPLIIGIIAGAAVLLTAAIAFVLVFFVFSGFNSNSYFIRSYKTAESDDYLLTLCVNKERAPVTINVKNGSAQIIDNKNDVYANLRYNKNEQKGTIEYTDGDKKDVSVIDKENTFTVKDGDAVMDFEKTEINQFKELVGEYAAVDCRDKSSQNQGEFFEKSVKHGKYFISHFSLEYFDSKNEYKDKYKDLFEDEINKDFPDKFFLGTISFPNGDLYSYSVLTDEGYKSEGKSSGFMHEDNGILKYYIFDEGVVCYFKNTKDIDLSKASSEYNVSRITSAEYDDLINYWKQNNYIVPDKLTVKADGSGTIVNSYDNSTFATFKVDPSNMTGTIKYSKNNSEKCCYVTVSENYDTVTVYDFDYKHIYAYSKDGAKKADTQDQSITAGDYILQKFSYKEKDGNVIDDYLDTVFLDNKKIPYKMTIKADGTGQIIYHDGKKHADFKLDTTNGTGSLTQYDGKKFNLSAIASGDTVTLYYGEFNMGYTSKPKAALDALIDSKKKGKFLSIKSAEDEDVEVINKSSKTLSVYKSDDDGKYHISYNPKGASTIAYNWMGTVDTNTMMADVQRIIKVKPFKNEKSKVFVDVDGDKVSIYDIENKLVYKYSFE